MSILDQIDMKNHIPVLPEEVFSYLNIQKEGIYLDGTIGLGGHASSILSTISGNGRLIGIDRDKEALEICKERLVKHGTNFTLHHNSYHNISKILKSLDIDLIDGILLDLGLSSLQLNSSDRGFNFVTNSKLDMRFDKSQETTAKDLINLLEVNKLADIIYKYGEERRSRIIAQNIGKVRPITQVFELLEAIEKSTPPKNRKKSISRVFQAIRIAVNDELGKLESFLNSFHLNLKIGGRAAIISFHSLEDRMVKHAFKKLEKEKIIKVLTKKPVTPSSSEVEYNIRSRSSKLRVAERIL